MIVKALFCDLDDTLAPTRFLYEEAIEKARQVYNKYTGLSVSEQDFLSMYKEARDDVHSLVPSSGASHNRILYFQRLVEDADIPTDYELVHQLYVEYYNHVYNNIKLFDGVIDVFKWARETGKKIVLVSDGNTYNRIYKIKMVGLMRYIDYLVSSEEVGTDKPSIQPYLLAAYKAGIKPQDAVMIGDNEGKDILGARRLGMKSIRVDICRLPEDVTPSAKDNADYVIYNFAEVKDIILEIENTV